MDQFWNVMAKVDWPSIKMWMIIWLLAVISNKLSDIIKKLGG